MDYLVFDKESDEMIDLLVFDTLNDVEKYTINHPDVYLVESDDCITDDWEEE